MDAMSRGMQPKIGDEPIRPGGNRGLSMRQEQQSRPDELDDLSESYLNTLSINLGKPGAMPAYPALDDRKNTP
jgi:hypothetical protein